MTTLATLLHLLVLAAPNAPTYDAEIAAAVLDVETIHYVPPALVKAIIRCESDFNPRALSQAGAIGLMQVMPFTAARVGLMEQDLWDPAKNILAGSRLLAVLLRYYDGDLISALVAYNARPRRLYAPIPQNGETARYVNRVLGYFQYSRAADSHSPGNQGQPASQVGRAYRELDIPRALIDAPRK